MLATAEVAASLAYYQPDRASRLAEQAEQLAWTVTDSATRAAALAQIAIGYARAGEWDQAERAADSVTDLEHRKRAVGQIAVAFARAGQTDRAQRVADGLSDPGDRASALAAAAGVLAGSDPSTATQFADQAEQLARTVADYEARSRVLAQVIVARFRTNQQNYTAKIWPLAIGRLQPWEKADLAVLLANIDPDSAVSLADEAADLLGSVLDKAAVLTEIAVAIAKSGQTDRAERIARSLRSPRKRARIAAEVAAACARAGQWDRADRITRTIRDSEIQVQARIKIITVLADVGQWDRCEEIVQAMGSSPEREQALVIIAERMACVIPHLGDSQDRLAEKFRHILARVLVSEHWNLALPVFGQAAPEELAAVLEAVTRDDMPE
jgi:lipopolysaccharide biosynthesis regulator YciM